MYVQKKIVNILRLISDDCHKEINPKKLWKYFKNKMRCFYANNIDSSCIKIDPNIRNCAKRKKVRR